MNEETETLYNEINNAIAECDKCEDCEFYGDKGDCQNKRIAKALIDLGYRKQEVKTIGDKIRSMSDEELANYLITSDYYYDEGVKIKYITPKGSFLSKNEAYQANLEWLKQEHKGE